MASLCHPWFTTTNLSYRLPILKLPPLPCAVLLVNITNPRVTSTFAFHELWPCNSLGPSNEVLEEAGQGTKRCSTWAVHSVDWFVREKINRKTPKNHRTSWENLWLTPCKPHISSRKRHFMHWPNMRTSIQLGHPPSIPRLLNHPGPGRLLCSAIFLRPGHPPIAFRSLKQRARFGGGGYRMGPPSYELVYEPLKPSLTIVISTIKPLTRQLSYLGGPILYPLESSFGKMKVFNVTKVQIIQVRRP